MNLELVSNVELTALEQYWKMKYEKEVVKVARLRRLLHRYDKDDGSERLVF